MSETGRPVGNGARGNRRSSAFERPPGNVYEVPNLEPNPAKKQAAPNPEDGVAQYKGKPKRVITTGRTPLAEGTVVEVEILGKDWVRLMYMEEGNALRDGKIERIPLRRMATMARTTFDNNTKKITPKKEGKA